MTGGVAPLDLAQLFGNARGEEYAACAYAGEQQVFHAFVFFDDLERDAGQRPAHAVRVHDDGLLFGHPLTSLGKRCKKTAFRPM